MNKNKWLKLGLMTATLLGVAIATIPKASASLYTKTADIQGVVYGSNMFEDEWANHIIKPGYNSSSLALASALQGKQSSKLDWELNNSTGTNQDKSVTDLYPQSKRDRNFDVTQNIFTTTRYKSSWSAYNNSSSTTRTVVPTNYNLSLTQTINTVQNGVTAINNVKVYRMNVSDYNALPKKADTQIDLTKADDISNASWVKKYYGINVADKGYEKTSKENKISSWSTSRQVVVNIDLKNSPEYKEFWKNHTYDKAYAQNHSDTTFKDDTGYPKEDYVYFVQTEQKFTDKSLTDDVKDTASQTQDTKILGGPSSTAIKTSDGYDLSATSWRAGSTQNTAPWTDYKDNGTHLINTGTTKTVGSGIANVSAQKRVSISTTMTALNAVPLLQNLMPALTYTSVYDDTNSIQNMASDQIKFVTKPLTSGQSFHTSDNDYSQTNRQGKSSINGQYGYLLHAYVPAIYKDKLATDPQQALKDAKVVMNTKANSAIDVDVNNAKLYYLSSKTLQLTELTSDTSDLTTDADIYVYVPAKVKDVDSSNYDEVMKALNESDGKFTTSFSISSLNYYSKDVTVTIPKGSYTTSYYKYGTAPEHKATGYTGDSQYVTNPNEVTPVNKTAYIGLKTSLLNKTPDNITGWTYANQSSSADDNDRITEGGVYEQWFSYKRVYTTRIQKVAQYPMHKLNDTASISKTNPLVGSVDIITAMDSNVWAGYNVADDPDITNTSSKNFGTNKSRILSNVSKLKSINTNFVSTSERSDTATATTYSSLKAVSSETNNGVNSTYSATRQNITSDKSVTINGGISFSLAKSAPNISTIVDYKQKPWVDFEVSDKTVKVASPIADTDNNSINSYSYSDNTNHTIKQPAERVLLYNNDGSVKETKTLDETHEVQLKSPATATINGGDAVSVDAVTKVTSYGKYSIERTNHGYNLDLNTHSAGLFGGLDEGANDGYVGIGNTFTIDPTTKKPRIYSLKVTDDIDNPYPIWTVKPTISGLDVTDQKLLSHVNPNTTDASNMLDSSGKIASVGDKSSSVDTDSVVSSLQPNTMTTSANGNDDTNNDSIDRIVMDGSDKITGSVSLSQATTTASTRQQYTYVGHQTFNKSVIDKGKDPTQTFGNYVNASSNQRSTSGKLLTPAMYAPSSPVNINVTIGGQRNSNYFLTNPKITLTTQLVFESTRFPAINDTASHKEHASFTIEPTNANRINTLPQFKPYRAFYNSK